MATTRRPVSFSRHFGIRTTVLAAAGAFDPILNADSRLFIDPLLLSASATPEAQQAAKRIRTHFEKILWLLSASKADDDVPWRAARKLMRYKEVAATCLGYGTASTAGSALGPAMSASLLKTTKQI